MASVGIRAQGAHAAWGKRFVPRHHGRESFWAIPGTSMSRAACDRLERALERRTRASGRAACAAGLDDWDFEDASS